MLANKGNDNNIATLVAKEWSPKNKIAYNGFLGNVGYFTMAANHPKSLILAF